MATSTIDQGNYLLVGNTVDGQMQEFFAEIISITPASGTHNIRLQAMLNMTDRSEIDSIISMTKEELMATEYIRIMSKEEGEEFYSRTTSSGSPSTLREPPRTASNEPTEETVEDRGEEISPVETLQPTIIEETQVDCSIGENSYDLSLNSGDMRTVLNIAQKNISKVFQPLDTLVQKTGHAIMDKLDVESIEKLIAYKIEETKLYTTLSLVKGTFYRLVKDEISVDAKYLGANHWAIVMPNRNIPEFSSEFMSISPSFYKSLYIQLMEEDKVSSAMVDSYSKLTARIDSYLQEELGRAVETPILTMREDTPDRVTSNDLGENWTKALSYHYLKGGVLDLSNLDISTFKDAPTIKRLAEHREDISMIEALTPNE